MAMILIWACRASSGENGGVVLSWEVGCNGRRMALKLVGQIILVSMVTNLSYQTDPITIKPPPCRMSCGEHSGVMFMGGWVERLHLDLKIFRGGFPKKVKKVKKKRMRLFPVIIQFPHSYHSRLTIFSSKTSPQFPFFSFFFFLFFLAPFFLLSFFLSFLSSFSS